VVQRLKQHETQDYSTSSTAKQPKPAPGRVLRGALGRSGSSGSGKQDYSTSSTVTQTKPASGGVLGWIKGAVGGALGGGADGASDSGLGSSSISSSSSIGKQQVGPPLKSEIEAETKVKAGAKLGEDDTDEVCVCVCVSAWTIPNSVQKLKPWTYRPTTGEIQGGAGGAAPRVGAAGGVGRPEQDIPRLHRRCQTRCVAAALLKHLCSLD
jgi:hypothetical protein